MRWPSDTAAQGVADLVVVATPSGEAVLAVDFAAAAGFVAALTGVTLAAVAFVMAAFAVTGSGIAASMTLLSSAILETRSFIIRIRTTDTIRPGIILTVTDTILTINLFTKAALDIPTP